MPESDPTAPQQPPDSGLELDRTPKAPLKPPPARGSGGAAKPVRTAQRAQQIHGEDARQKIGDRTVDVLLNALSLLRDVADDFRNSDRFFKYKALVLGLWLVASSSSLLVACPGSGPTNTIGANLIVTADATNTKKVYTIKNDSSDAWQSVEVVVNGTYRSTASQVEPNEAMGLNILIDGEGKRAPSSLIITDIDINVGDPDAHFTMLRHGEPP